MTEEGGGNNPLPSIVQEKKGENNNGERNGRYGKTSGVRTGKYNIKKEVSG